MTLSRDFGHQIAITAGMDFACGEAVVIMDADLQDPPELVPTMIERWKGGYDVVYAVRTARLRGIGLQAADRALNAFTTMRERDRFVRGLFGWIGLRQTGVPYVRAARLAGETKYPLAKMLRLAMNGIVAFSDAPLRLAIWLGVIVSFGAAAYAGMCSSCG